MNSYLKHGVSAMALLAAMSVAYAQTAEHQGADKGGTIRHMQNERGGKESGAQHQGNANERGKANGNERQGLAQGQGRGNAGRGESRAAQEGGTGTERRTNAGQRNGREEQGQRAVRRGQAQREEHGRQTQRDTRGHRTAKNAPSEQQEEQTKQREGEGAQGNERKQRESQAGSVGRNEEVRREGEHRNNIHISGNQKTQLRESIVSDKSIRRLHRGDVRFSLEIGSRVPDTVEFYDPPRRFVDIDPEFRRYKVIVLDDEILIIDPATREIVDVIPT